jgi:hypothetical protein
MGRQAIERNLTMGSEWPSAALGPSGNPNRHSQASVRTIDRFGPTLLGKPVAGHDPAEGVLVQPVADLSLIRESGGVVYHGV